MNVERVEESPARRNGQLLWAAQFVNTTGLMMLVPIMPLYMATLDRSDGHRGLWAGVAVAAPALPLALTTPLWGRLGDRIGRKWMVVRALVGLAAAMVVMGAASTPLLLVVGRLLQGTVGGVVEAALAFAGSESEDGRKGRALGRSYSATAAGSLVGPVAGGALVTSDRLTDLMFALAVLASILAVACAFGLSTSQRPHHIHVRVDEAASHTRWWSSAIRSIGVPILVAGVLVNLGVYGLIPVYPSLVETTVDLPSSTGPWVGVLHAVMWGGTLVGSLFWGKLNDASQNPLRTLAWAAASTALFIAVQAWMQSPWSLLPVRFCQGLGIAALAQSILLHASERAPSSQRAAYMGLANSSLLAGQFAGPLATGALLAILAAPTLVHVTAASLAIAGVASLLGLRHRSGTGAAIAGSRRTERKAVGAAVGRSRTPWKPKKP